jgi:hypothetical protein
MYPKKIKSKIKSNIQHLPREEDSDISTVFSFSVFAGIFDVFIDSVLHLCCYGTGFGLE